MSFSRACLFSFPLSGALIAGGLHHSQAQSLPAGLTRSGDVVMMKPIADATGDTGSSTTRQSRLRFLTPPERDIFSRAFDAAGRGDWTAARALAAQGQNTTARRLLEWRYAMDRNSGATFAEIDAVIKDTDGKGASQWPLRGTLQARAEAVLPPDMAPSAVVAWFSGKPPNSSIGKIRLGEALVATGEKTRGATLIRQGWIEGSFDTAIELDIVQKDSAHLTPQSDRARLNNLIWAGQTSAARRLLARVDGNAADIANARIALAGGIPKNTAVLDKVADSSDPALLLDWSRALRLAGRDREANAMLLRTPTATLVRDRAARWWNETAIQARSAFTSGNPRMALDLVRHAGFTSGIQFAEQEFLAGFIALRFLKEPAAALEHFRKLEAGVARPISKSRALYWQGRSLEAQGDIAAALERYRAAAAYPDTFYGQVALARTDTVPVLRLADTQVDPVPPSEVEAAPLINEIKVLADLGQASSLRSFIERHVESHSAPRHITRLMMMLNDWGYPEISVRLAKSLGYDGVPMPQFSYPVIALPAYVGPGSPPDPALVLGLIRQETEFDAYAISRAGARGLMQMMPASAKVAAKQANLPYRPDALLSDTVYNMQLGMTEYRVHLDRYGGSLILAAASYNAGPGNSRKWVAAYGDPRTQHVDPIDWIEQIPFGETRNYVQRVLENAQVYRARLAGKDVPLRILPDLYAPQAPSVTVLTAK
jgi:soluble lytic murein transglycosylase